MSVFSLPQRRLPIESSQWHRTRIPLPLPVAFVLPVTFCPTHYFPLREQGFTTGAGFLLINISVMSGPHKRASKGLLQRRASHSHAFALVDSQWHSFIANNSFQTIDFSKPCCPFLMKSSLAVLLKLAAVFLWQVTASLCRVREGPKLKNRRFLLACFLRPMC